MALMRIDLFEEDAERLGCPQSLELDLERLTGRQIIAMRRHTGWSLERLERAISGEPVAGIDGKPMHELDEAGQVVRDPGGNPVLLLAIDPEALLVLSWLAVNGAKEGGEVAWNEFDLMLLRTGFSGAQGGDEEPGKAPAGRKPRTTSRRGTAATKRR